MTEKRDFLAGLPIFADLSEAALEAIARITQEYAFDDNAVIAYQRDIASRLYIVKEGRLFARTIDNNGITRETFAYTPGSYFNEMWLFIPGVHLATIKGAAQNGGRLYVIEGQAFVHLLKRYPSIIDFLAPREEGDIHYGLSDEAWIEAQKLKVRPRRVKTSVGGSLLPDERLEFFARRSLWFLLGRLILPFFMVLLAAAILIAMPDSTGLERAVKVGAPILLTIIGSIIFALRLIDFRADYFIITNKHLTHHEFELRHFRIHLVKVPIAQVQTVEILKPSLLANLFNIGTARVTTAAVAGVILFDNIDKPLTVKTILNRLTEQYKSLESAQTQAVMRQSIEKHFGLNPQLTPAEEAVNVPANAPKVGFIDRLRTRFGWRVVDGDTITYRKSLFILLREVALPLLGFLVLGVAFWLALNLSLNPWVLASIFTILGIVNTGWFVWQLENWRNDIFMLSDRFVLDVDRKPFGFGESRKQAAITNIQNVAASRPGFLATIFNFGFVSIDTAGSQSEIVFDYVPHPELIQSDIFQRIDESRRRQRIQEGSTRRQEYALLLDVYRQAMEQHRIPQRTPTEQPPDSEEL